MFKAEDIDKFNEEVRLWAFKTKSQAASQLDALGVQHRPKSKSPIALKKSLRTAFRKDAGIISRIVFTMPQHGIYLQRGVGKGTKITERGLTKRQAKEFLTPVINNNIGKLEEIVANHSATLIINAITIK